MKIITDDAVYVQKNDFAYLNHSELSIPASIFLKVCESGVFIVCDENRYDFIKFSEPHEIEFFKDIDWIIDYNDVKDLSLEDIVEVANKINDERRELALKFNPMSPEEKEKNVDMYYRSEYLNYKFLSLRDYVWFRQGHLKFDLPEGVLYPESEFDDTIIRNSNNNNESVSNNVSEQGDVIEEKEEVNLTGESHKGVKKFLKTIFRKRK